MRRAGVRQLISISLTGNSPLAVRSADSFRAASCSMASVGAVVAKIQCASGGSQASALASSSSSSRTVTCAPRSLGGRRQGYVGVNEA